jgi:hypothetical protein
MTPKQSPWLDYAITGAMVVLMLILAGIAAHLFSGCVSGPADIGRENARGVPEADLGAALLQQVAPAVTLPVVGVIGGTFRRVALPTPKSPAELNALARELEIRADAEAKTRAQEQLATDMRVTRWACIAAALVGLALGLWLRMALPFVVAAVGGLGVVLTALGSVFFAEYLPRLADITFWAVVAAGAVGLLWVLWRLRKLIVGLIDTSDYLKTATGWTEAEKGNVTAIQQLHGVQGWVQKWRKKGQNHG